MTEPTDQPATADQPIQPATVDQPIQPATVDQPIQPATVDQPIQPATVDQPIQPATVDQPIQLATADQQIQLATADQQIQPATADQQIQPATVDQPIQPTTVDQPVQSATADSGWKQFLDFLWNGGFRSLIVLTVVVCAGWITIDNQNICANVPTMKDNQQPTPLVTNPTCSKYFELTLAIVGGYLGLSLPSRSQSSSDE